MTTIFTIDETSIFLLKSLIVNYVSFWFQSYYTIIVIYISEA